MNLIMLALMGRGRGFENVLNMIDEMVALLAKEQTDDDSKKSFCEIELDKAEDHKKQLDLEVADLGKEMAETEDAIATLKTEIGALEAGIKALDASVAKATSQRKAENS